jgi:glutaredoxin
METLDNSAGVTLFVIPGCPLCSHARAWLERHGVSHVVRDVAVDYAALRAMYRKTRQKLVPVVEHEGRALVRPSDEELSALLL